MTCAEDVDRRITTSEVPRYPADQIGAAYVLETHSDEGIQRRLSLADAGPVREIDATKKRSRKTYIHEHVPLSE